MSEHVDIAIVGAGPAGSYLAYCLGQKGIRATLFDHSHAREKPCGGGISCRALRMFPFLGQIPGPQDRGSRIQIISPAGREVELGRGKTAEMIGISRMLLDSHILEMALHAGASLLPMRVLAVRRETAGWSIETADMQIRCRVLVGADGARSVVRASTVGPHRNRDLAACYGCLLTGHTPGLSVISFPPGRQGYIWAFDRGSDACVGIGDRLGRGRGLKATLELFIERRIHNARVHSRWGAILPSAHSPSAFRAKCAGADWLLVGDAAGHVDPVTGEGILFALWSAALAADSIATGKPQDYDTAWRRVYLPELWRGAILRRVFYSKLLLNSAIWFAQHNRAVGDGLYQAITGG